MDYLLYFLKQNGVPTEEVLPDSERGAELRKLFTEADDEKAYPFLVMTEEINDKEDRVLFKAIRPREGKLYPMVRLYNYGEEVSDEKDK